jgi:type IV pilus assembly protein PilP
MMRHLLPILIGVVGLVTTASPLAQTPAPPASAGQPPSAPDPQAAPTPPPNYAYSPDGRRDPFLSLVSGGTDSGRSAPGRRPAGLAGVAVSEVVVRGILRSGDGYLAMVQASDGRTYTVRQGDQLFDGRIQTITAEAVILTQEVNDPLSTEKQREVRKPLRGGQEGN